MKEVNNNKNTCLPCNAEQTAFEYSGRPNEDIHAYSKLNPVRLAKYVLLVLIIHFVLILLLWWAGRVCKCACKCVCKNDGECKCVCNEEMKVEPVKAPKKAPMKPSKKVKK